MSELKLKIFSFPKRQNFVRTHKNKSKQQIEREKSLSTKVSGCICFEQDYLSQSSARDKKKGAKTKKSL
eukprot:UN23409